MGIGLEHKRLLLRCILEAPPHIESIGVAPNMRVAYRNERGECDWDCMPVGWHVSHKNYSYLSGVLRSSRILCLVGGKFVVMKLEDWYYETQNTSTNSGHTT